MIKPSAPSNDDDVPNVMQYTIRKLYSTKRNCTLRSVRKLNHPYGSNGSLSLLSPTLSSNSYVFSQVSLMKCNLQSVNCTIRSVRALYHPYGSNGSLSLLPQHYHETALFFLSPPNEMQYTIRKLYSTERKATNNPYGSNGSLSLSPTSLCER